MTFSYATTPITHKCFPTTQKINKNFGSLQTGRKYLRTSKTCFRTNTPTNESTAKRSFLYTSPLCKGSITLEASIAIPLFFLALLSFIYIINIMHLQLTLQIALEETVRDISKEAYISSEFYSMSSDEQSDVVNKDFSFVENLGATVISVSYIRNKFLSDDINKILDNSFVANGSKGISFMLSSVDMNTNTIDVTISYKCSIPFISSSLLSFNLSNRCYFRIYMGQDMEKEQKDAYFYVYRTHTSSVTHTKKYCQYLLNYSKAIRYREIVRMHPINGCALCARDVTIETLNKTDAIVYLTANEEVYHVTLDCQSFTGDIFRFKVSSLDNEDICEKCLEGE